MLATVNPEPAAISKTSVLLILEASIAPDWVSMLEGFAFTSTIKAFPDDSLKRGLNPAVRRRLERLARYSVCCSVSRLTTTGHRCSGALLSLADISLTPRLQQGQFGNPVRLPRISLCEDSWGNCSHRQPMC